MAYAAKRNPNSCPTHPGALLREDIIPAVGRSVTEIADLLGISRQHLHAIMAEKKPVTAKVASCSVGCSGTDQRFGFACKRLMIRGMRKMKLM